MQESQSGDEIEHFQLVSGRASFPNEMTIGQTRTEWRNWVDEIDPLLRAY